MLQPVAHQNNQCINALLLLLVLCSTVRTAISRLSQVPSSAVVRGVENAKFSPINVLLCMHYTFLVYDAYR